MVTLDSDCNGVFKITDKNTQTLKVVQSDGTHTLTQTFDLSGLTLATPAQNVIVPNSATFDKNSEGSNHTAKTFTVTPATAGATITALLDDDTDEIPSVYDGTTVWMTDSSGLAITLTITLLDGLADSFADGDTISLSVRLSDGSTIGLTINVEKT